MTQTISAVPALAAPIVPDLVQAYDWTSASRNQLHPIYGRADVEATLHPAGLRSGTMLLVFQTKAAAFTAYAALRGVGIFTLTDTDVPEASLTFIVQDQLNLKKTDGRITWTVSVGFQEVVA